MEWKIDKKQMCMEFVGRKGQKYALSYSDRQK